MTQGVIKCNKFGKTQRRVGQVAQGRDKQATVDI